MSDREEALEALSDIEYCLDVMVKECKRTWSPEARHKMGIIHAALQPQEPVDVESLIKECSGALDYPEGMIQKIVVAKLINHLNAQGLIGGKLRPIKLKDVEVLKKTPNDFIGTAFDRVQKATIWNDAIIETIEFLEVSK